MSGLDLLLLAESDFIRDEPCAGSENPVDYSREYFLAWRADEGQEAYTLSCPMQLGVVTLGSHLARRGFSVRVVDRFLSDPVCAAAAREALARGPAVVGLSTTFLTRAETVERVAGLVRSLSPGSLFVLGGAAAGAPGWAQRADAAVLGDGERALEGLLAAARGGRERAGPRLIRADDFPLDEVGEPDWGLLDELPLACLPVEGSRGCRYDCSFCNYPGRGAQRYRDPSRVAAEIAALAARRGVGLVRFVDSNLTSDPDWVLALCRALSGGPRVEWSGYARPEDLHRRPDLAPAMAAAGCRWLYCGVESGNTAVRRAAFKGGSSEQVRDALRRARDAGLYVHGSFIVGLPGETPATVDDSLELIRAAGLTTAGFYVLNLSEIGDARLTVEPQRWGLEGRWQDWRHPTMDSATARRELRRCMDELCRSGDTFIGSEFQAMFYLRGRGLTDAEVFDYYRTMRAHHLASRAGDAPARRAAARLLRGYEERMEAFSAARTGRRAVSA